MRILAQQGVYGEFALQPDQPLAVFQSQNVVGRLRQRGIDAFEQAREFTRATKVTSLTITKLDGTAKGGVVIGISDQFHIPVRYIGIGEGIDQLRMFDRREFVDALFGDRNDNNK